MGHCARGENHHSAQGLHEGATAWIDQNITELQKHFNTENIALRKITTELTQKVTFQQDMLDYLGAKCKATTDRLIKLESYSMRENIIISGLDEEERETEDNLYDTLMELFSTDMSLDMSNIHIVRCHRLAKGAKKTGPRDVIVRFSTHNGKTTVLYSAHKLKGRNKPLYINEQFPKEIEQKRRILRPILKQGKELNKKCSLIVDKLFIEGKPYTVNNISEIPFDTASLTTKETNSHVMFSGRLSPYSNFFTRESLFTAEDGNKYSCTEQFYQYTRAIHSGNKTAAMEILSETDPVVMKHIGDAFRGNQDWDKIAHEVMQRGVGSKFTQNSDLATMLKSTGTKTFLECNRYDPFWGTGSSLADTASQADPMKIKGKNIMGKILSDVRDQITNSG